MYLYKNYLRFDNIFEAIFFGALGYIYESTLFGTTCNITDETKHIFYAGSASAENTRGHIHA